MSMKKDSDGLHKAISKLAYRESNKENLHKAIRKVASRKKIDERGKKKARVEGSHFKSRDDFVRMHVDGYKEFQEVESFEGGLMSPNLRFFCLKVNIVYILYLILSALWLPSAKLFSVNITDITAFIAFLLFGMLTVKMVRSFMSGKFFNEPLILLPIYQLSFIFCGLFLFLSLSEFIRNSAYIMFDISTSPTVYNALIWIHEKYESLSFYLPYICGLELIALENRSENNTARH